MEHSGWYAEIVELHTFFQGWLDGSLPNSDVVFARLPSALAPEFALVSPSGEMARRAELLAQLRAGHASRPGWRMWIERPELRCAADELLVATYEEWHQAAESTTARISTAVFRRHAAAPNHLLWLHVHETWLPNANRR
jgi:hypothetical protein